MANLVLLCRDLMLSSRIDGVARNLGYSVSNVADAEAALSALDNDQSQIMFIDLQLPGLDISALVEESRRLRGAELLIIACGPHVHEQRLEAARSAGCDRVVTKGQFDRDAKTILQINK